MTVEGLLVGSVSLAVIVAWFLLPGLPWALLWRRRQGLDLLDTAALVVALGVSLGSLSATLLLLLGALRPVPLLLLAGALTLVGTLLFGGLVLRDQIRAARFGAGPTPPLEPRLRLGGLAARIMLSAVLLVGVVPQMLSTMPSGLPLASTSWYYWYLAEVAGETGALPPATVEWAAERPFKADYLPFTAHLAAADLLDPIELATLETYRLAVLGGAALLLVAFARRWTLGGGILFASLIVAGNLWTTKFAALRPETFALLLLLGAFWAADRASLAVGRETTRWVLLAGVLGGLVAASHIEVFMVGGIVGLGLLAIDGRGVPRDRWRIAGGALAVAALTAITLLLAGGGGLPGAGELGQREDPGGDPTWQLYGALWGLPASVPPPDSWLDQNVLAATARSPWFGTDLLMLPGIVALVVALLAVTVVLAGREPADLPQRRLVLFGIIVLLALVLVSLVAWQVFETYVPRRIGPRRILPYAVIGLTAILTAVALQAWAAAGRWWRRRAAPAGRRPARSRADLSALVVGGICLVLASWLIAAGAVRTFIHSDRPQVLAVAARDAYRWIERNTSPSALVLANAYTDGAVAALADRPGLLDGRAPYGEDAAWRQQAIDRSRAARAFFLAPTEAALEALAPDYLVVGPSEAVAAAVGYPADIGRLQRLPGLRLAAIVGPVTIFQVEREGSP